MKTIIAVLMAVVLAATAAFAADLAWTPYQNFHAVNQAPIQFFAPDSTGIALTAAGTVQAVSTNVLYMITAGSSGTCYYRPLTANTPAAKAASQAILIPASTERLRAVNPTITFVNMSGCTGGYFQRQ